MVWLWALGKESKTLEGVLECELDEEVEQFAQILQEVRLCIEKVFEALTQSDKAADLHALPPARQYLNIL